jgi:PAS domain S-box-containing protein
MDAQEEHPAEEVKRLQRCMNDLISMMALPALWSGGDPSQIARTLIDVLQRLLHLDLIYVQLNDPTGDAPIEMARGAQIPARVSDPNEIGAELLRSLGDDSQKWPPRAVCRLGDKDLSIVPVRLGLGGELDMLVAGAERSDFPGQTEELLLRTAANHAAMALHEARLRNEQKRLADELDQRVAHQTMELAAADRQFQQSQEELRRTEEQTRLIIDTALDAVVTMDASGKITSWNKQAQVVFGWNSTEAIGRLMSELIIPLPQRAAHERGLRHFLATGEGPLLRRRIEITAIRRDGVEFPVELEVMPLKLGEDWAFSAFIRDITDSKQAEQKLRESELNLRQLTETIPEMLWSATPDGGFDYCNARLLDYTGFAAQEMMGNKWTRLIHPDDVEPTMRAWMSCVTSGAQFQVEVRIIHASDRMYRWCVANALPLLDKDGRILKWHGTVVDMHDWKQAQETLRNTQAELANMTRVMTMGQLTASIAHEVNQPLSGIITNASTCLRMLDADPPNVEGARETARRTIRDGNRAAEIITRLRALFSKRQTTTESVDLNEATKEVTALLLSKLQRDGVVLRCELADDLPPVAGDRVQLQQVIMNLLQNASDAMVGVQDRSRQLLIQTQRDETDHVRLTVRDSGIGLDPQAANRLFDAFYTTKNGGMGIGLAVSRSIIENHRGRIWVEPKEGPGTTLSFSIPAGARLASHLSSSRKPAAGDPRAVVRDF